MISVSSSHVTAQQSTRTVTTQKEEKTKKNLFLKFQSKSKDAEAFIQIACFSPQWVQNQWKRKQETFSKLKKGKNKHELKRG